MSWETLQLWPLILKKSYFCLSLLDASVRENSKDFILKDVTGCSLISLGVT